MYLWGFSRLKRGPRNEKKKKLNNAKGLISQRRRERKKNDISFSFKTAGAICGHSLKYINGLNRSKKYKKGYSKFSIAFCGLLQRMMDFCKVRRILISALTLLFVAPLGSNQRCVYFGDSFWREKNVYGEFRTER